MAANLVQLSAQKARNQTYPTTAVTAGNTVSASVSVKVANTGKFAGEEVVQLYLSFPKVAGRAEEGPSRISARPPRARSHAKVKFGLNPRNLSIVIEASEPVIAEGEFALSGGGGQPGYHGTPGHADFPDEKQPYST